MIEHLDGTSGMVVRRGSNYVSYENDGLVKKAWLYDIQMSEEIKEQNKLIKQFTITPNCDIIYV